MVDTAPNNKFYIINVMETGIQTILVVRKINNLSVKISEFCLQVHRLDKEATIQESPKMKLAKQQLSDRPQYFYSAARVIWSTARHAASIG